MALKALSTVVVPVRDQDAALTFYTDVLGLEQDAHTLDKPFSEFDIGGTTLSVWDPSMAGREFVANTNAIALHTDDVKGLRAELEGKGVQFFGDTVDTGVCHMAFFADPDGNPLMLHGRYVPR